MTKEIVDEVTVYSKIFSEGEVDWNVLIRPLGSVSLYATWPGAGCVGVAFDSCDNVWAEGTADRVIAKLAEMHEAIEAVLTAVKAKPAQASAT